jgi:hypothetical protein
MFYSKNHFDHGAYYQLGAKKLQPNFNLLSRSMISNNMEIN